MSKPLVVAAAVLGVVFLVLACVYWFVPAGSLPHFMPGFVDGSSHVHVKHGSRCPRFGAGVTRICLGQA